MITLEAMKVCSRARKALENDNFVEASKIISPLFAQRSELLDSMDAADVCSIYMELLFRTSKYSELEAFISDYQKTAAGVANHYLGVFRAWMIYHKGLYVEALSAFPKTNREIPVNVRAEYLRVYGMASARLGRYRRSISNLRDSVALYRACGDTPRVASSLISLGAAEITFSNMIKAIEYLTEACSLIPRKQRTQRLGDALHNLAIAEYKVGRLADAENHLLEAHAVFSYRGQQLSSLRADIQLVRVLLDKDEGCAAREKALAILAVTQEMAYRREEAITLETLGDIAARQHKCDSAERYYLCAQSIANEIAPEGDLVAESTRRLASLHLFRGEPFECVPFLKKAITTTQKCGERYEAGIAYRHLSQAYRELEQYQQAVCAARESVEIFQSMGARLELAHSRLEAARACRDWYHVLAGNMLLGACVDNPNPYTHLETAWGHVIEAYRDYGELERPEEQKTCEDLMDELHSEGRPVWLRGPSMPADVAMKVNNKPFIATSPAMKSLIALVEVSAGTTEPVLVTGETGTGKELIARLIHEKSDRAKRPFVPVNCAAIPETLFEREFFGHARGAFTGADNERPGLCEAANHGTMFLDEIGDMPAYLQVKLLRILQEGTFHRLGDPAERRVDLRIIAATNAPLPELINEGRFRQDLYYRLQTLEMSLPPLRERVEDLELLIRLFAGKIMQEDTDPRDIFDSDVMQVLENYPWPGNVRELEAMTRRLALMARHSGRATLEMLPEPMRKWHTHRPEVSGSLQLAAYVEKVERERISQALMIKNGNRSDAARALGISRNQLYRKMEKFKIRMPV